jgi:hypothetical protein
MVTFTGSTSVGRETGALCGEQVKRVSLELGGKSAAIVLEDADAAAPPRASSSRRSSTAARHAPRTRVSSHRGAVTTRSSTLWPPRSRPSRSATPPPTQPPRSDRWSTTAQQERVLSYIDAGSVVLVPAGQPHAHAIPAESSAEYVYLTTTGHSTDVLE